ncbi:unnamed protein product [Effrenium voratum]|nr:unnamed protein product [Effrenium voratum]
MPHALIGVCPPAFGRESQEPFPAQLHPQSFWAPHFYDGVVLVGKIWTPDFGIEEVTDEQKLFGIFPAPSVRPVFGLEQRVTSYKKQLQSKCELARQEIPSILGEIGIPFDIKSASLGGETSDAVNEAADAHMRALEELMLPSCWWNYTPENTSARGDLWNGEDLSVFANGAGRLPVAMLRPHLLRCGGKPIAQSFQDGRFRCVWEVEDPNESVIWIPSERFQVDTTEVSVTPGVEVTWDRASQLMRCQEVPGRLVLELRCDRKDSSHQRCLCVWLTVPFSPWFQGERKEISRRLGRGFPGFDISMCCESDLWHLP